MAQSSDAELLAVAGVPLPEALHDRGRKLLMMSTSDTTLLCAQKEHLGQELVNR